MVVCAQKKCLIDNKIVLKIIGMFLRFRNHFLGIKEKTLQNRKWEHLVYRPFFLKIMKIVLDIRQKLRSRL